MLEILFWSLMVITWASFGMHVIKEYIRNHIKQKKNEYKANNEETKFIQKSDNVSCEWLEKSNEC